MPWKETETMIERERFVTLAQTGRFTNTDLCADFGISRKTGHKYLSRYGADGRVGLKDRSRRPKGCPFATAIMPEVEVSLNPNQRGTVKTPRWPRNDDATASVTLIRTIDPSRSVSRWAAAAGTISVSSYGRAGRRHQADGGAPFISGPSSVESRRSR